MQISAYYIGGFELNRHSLNLLEIKFSVSTNITFEKM